MEKDFGASAAASLYASKYHDTVRDLIELWDALDNALDSAESPHSEDCRFMRDNIVAAREEGRQVHGCTCHYAKAIALLNRLAPMRKARE